MLPSRVTHTNRKPLRLGAKILGAIGIGVLGVLLLGVSGGGKAEASQSAYWENSTRIRVGDSGMDTVTLKQVKDAVSSAQKDAQDSGQNSNVVTAAAFINPPLALIKVADAFFNAVNCAGCNRFYFSPTKTAIAGHPVFQDESSKKQLQFPIYKIAPRAGVRWPSGNSEGSYKPPDSAAAILTFHYEDNSTKPGEKRNGLDICSIEKYENCWENTDGGKEIKTFSSEKKKKIDGVLTAYGSAITATAGDINQGNEGCTAGGPLGFVFCPIKNLLDEANNKVLELIADGTVIHTEVFAPSNKSGVALRDTWGKILIIANSLFALIFIVIVFGNTLSLGIDSYTIKKALPRLVAAVVLAQFSYFIAGAIMELANLVGQGILTLFSQGGTLSVAALNKGSIGSGSQLVANILLEILFLLISLIAALVGILVLALRQIILIGLIITGPIAFAAWVLPGTQKAFKLWWSNLLKLSLMGPMIVGLIGGSLFLKGVVGTTKESLLVQFAAAALPIIALLYLPKTFKWSGNFMAATGGKVAEFGAKQGKKQTLGRASDSFNKAGGGKDKLAARGITPTFGTRARMERRGLAEANVQKRAEAGSSVAAREIAAMQGGEDFSAEVARGTASTDQVTKNQQFHAKQAAVENKLKQLGTPEAQAKFAATLAKGGDRDSVQTARRVMGDANWDRGVAANYSDYDGMADMRMSLKDANEPVLGKTVTGQQDHVSKLNAEGFVKGGGGTQAALSSAELMPYFNTEALGQLGTQGVRSKLSNKALSNFQAYRKTFDDRIAAGEVLSADDAKRHQALDWTTK